MCKGVLYEMKPYNIPKELSERLAELYIIDMALDELKTGIELHPQTEKDLEGIGIDPKEFTRNYS